MNGTDSVDGLTVPLHAAAAAGAAAVGVKAASLSTLSQAGLAVPEGLVLTAQAGLLVLADAGLGPDANPDQVLAAPLPEPVEAAVAAIADHFGDRVVAVRSSASREDLPDASFAGQYESVLGVRGVEELRAAVRRCWASAYGDRIRAYRPAEDPEPLAVLVQRQVEAEAAGVAFSVNPVSGADDEVLVSAVPGLGDDLVDGRETPDEWVVSGGDAVPRLVLHQALAEAQVRAVAALAKRVESVFGGPQDIEWAMADGRLVVLQARPVTAVPRPPVAELPSGTWVKDVEHYAGPISAFGASVAAEMVSGGLTAMFQSFGGLLERMDVGVVGGEVYLRPVPVGDRRGPPPPWWLLGLIARLDPVMRGRVRTAKRMVRPAVFDHLLGEWETTTRPALQVEAKRLRDVDLAALDNQALDGCLGEAIGLMGCGLRHHFNLIPLYTVPLHDLVTVCGDVLGWSEAEALDLVSGASPTSSEPSRALRELAARIAVQPRARAALDDAGEDLVQRLTAAAPDLGGALREWCDRFAYRCIHDDPGSPLWIERPWLIADLLRGLVHEQCSEGADGTAAGDPATVQQRAVERARLAMSTKSPAARYRFEAALSAAVRSHFLREDTAFWAASVPGGLVRQVLREVGRRLAGAGAVDRADDVAQLGAASVREALLGGGTENLRSAVRKARAERAWVSQHPGPMLYGPQPRPLPDLRGLPSPARRLNQALVWAQPRPPAVPEAAPGSGSGAGVALTGTPGSPGSYTGPVRVVRGEADFGRLRPGDVLVCPTTNPAWSVLFGRAGALVTDYGGPLSHAAIVAREHAIPAVLGTGRATRSLRDGEIITVSGTEGRVS